MHARNPRGAKSATSTSTSATPCALFTAPLACIQTQLRKWIKNIDTLESLAELEARQFEIRRDFHVKNGQKALLGPSAQSGEREIVQREQNAQNPFGLASGMLGTVQPLAGSHQLSASQAHGARGAGGAGATRP